MANPHHHDAFKILSNFFADIESRRKNGCSKAFSKKTSEKSTCAVLIRILLLFSNKALPKVIILQALRTLLSSWNVVSEETIANCFKEANISHVNQQTVVTDANNLYKSFLEKLDNWWKLD